MSGNILVGEKKPLRNECDNIGQILLNRLKSRPNFVGLVDAYLKKQKTYAEMRVRSVKCALWLKRQGIKSGDVIAICSNNHLDVYVPCFAALYSAAIINPWDHRMDTHAAEYFLNLTRPKIIFATESAAETLRETLRRNEIKEAPKVIVFGELEGYESLSRIIDNGGSSEEIESFECARISDPNETAVILFSSGTTGFPKGVEISHSRALHHMRLDELHFTSGTVGMSYSPLSWISGCAQLFHSVLVHSKRIIYPEFDEETTCKLIEEHKVEWMLCGGHVIGRLSISDVLFRYKLQSLKYIIIAGSPIAADTLRTLKNRLPNTHILKTYGMTELGTVTLQRKESKLESSGYLMSNTMLKIVELKTGNCLGANQVGELHIKSGTVTTGYYKDRKSTEDTIDSEGWLHTGDLAYFDENKEIYIVDRIKELIKYRGSHVSPSEIEKVLYSHPAVVEAAVVSVPDPLDDEHAVGFVTTHPSAKITEGELINFASKYLVEHKRLHGIKITKEIPQTPSGKIARKKLKDIAKDLFLT